MKAHKFSYHKTNNEVSKMTPTIQQIEFVKALEISLATFHRWENTDPDFPKRLQAAKRGVYYDMEEVKPYVKKMTGKEISA
jgi:predicted DNA-binding transcriptional regulator AlpA